MGDSTGADSSTCVVVVGVDGAGRTHRLGVFAAGAGTPAIWVTASDLATELATARAGGCLVVVDDAHRLDADPLRALAAAAREGVSMAVARRPTIAAVELAELDEAVAARGRVELLGPLDGTAIGTLLNRLTGQPAGPDVVAAVREASGGLAAIVAAIAVAPSGARAPALLARVQRRLAALDRETATLARILALRLTLTDDVLATAAELAGARLAAAMRLLRDEGLLVPDSEQMIPAVADAVLGELAPAERRRVHDAVARALVAGGGDAVTAASQLRAARAWSPVAAAVYQAAGDRLRFTAPAAAVGWYDDAVDAGADASGVLAGRAEAAAQLGLPVDLDRRPADPAGAVRFALVEGAVAAHQGRAARSAEALVGTGPPGPPLAVPALVGTGQPDRARTAATTGPAPVAVRRLAEAALAIPDPSAALPLLIEAAETVERHPPAVVLPDTPHALGALVAVTAGDAASAEYLLGRALAAGVGGPVAADRHRLLLAWVRMRTGRYDTAVAELARVATAALPGREALLAAAVAAGIARRSGDIARLRDTWAGVEQVLARGVVDLCQVELVEELVVAASRLRRQQRADPVLATLDGIVERLGRPPAWVVAVGWTRLQAAVAREDSAAAEAAAGELRAAGATGARQRAQIVAAGHWARALAGAVDPDAVVLAADHLAAAELPWEASRLVGQAAIRTPDAVAARRLLERARDLAAAELAAPDARPEAQLGGLSEREVEVARLVLDGRTYREIGAQLYISPKTVEHHVARTRTKLGATTRAEFVAALRELLARAGIGQAPGGHQ